MFGRLKRLASATSPGKGESTTVGVGCSRLNERVRKALSEVVRFLRHGSLPISLIAVVPEGTTAEFDAATGGEGLELEVSPNDVAVEEWMVQLLATGRLDGAVRGFLPSTPFLSAVRSRFGVSHTFRLALLETRDGTSFWFAPVGIDEDTPAHKEAFVRKGLELVRLVGLKPSVALLSAGRRGDAGRNERVRASLVETEALAKRLDASIPDAHVWHAEILLEKAVERGAGLVVAPDGVSGNLIYRTLVNLGGGRAFGAVYLGLDRPCVDTSRAGHVSELIGGALLAAALIKATEWKP
ncbi:MAG: hypothetical protein Kow0069_31070 [Promethearchaeota archaeon]